MHAVALQLLRTAHKPISRRACRVIGGSRHPFPRRSFHRSPISYRSPEDPAATEGGKENTSAGTADLESEEAKLENEGEDVTKSVESEGTIAVSKVRNGRAASGRIRGNRPKQPEGLPPVLLPEWFWKKNIKTSGDPTLSSGTLAVFGESGVSEEIEGEDKVKLEAEIARQSVDISECELETTEAAKYTIHVDVYREILATLRAGLALRPPKNASTLPIPRPITLLQCPKDGGSFFLDSVVETVASKLDADLIRVDAQDIAQIAGPYVEGNLAWHRSGTSILSYEAHRIAGKLEEYDKEMDEDEEAEAEDEEDASPAKGAGFPSIADLLKNVKSITGRQPSHGFTRSPTKFGMNGGIGMEVFTTQIPAPQQPQSLQPGPDQWNDLKMTAVLETIISASDTKRLAAVTDAELAGDGLEPKSRPLIVQIRDYKEMSGVPEGTDLLYRLKTVINKKWQEGKDIILVGTTSTEEREPALSRPEIQHLQSDIAHGEKRTIFVPPDRREQQDVAFETDEKARIRSINVRNVEDMILKLADGTQNLAPEINIEKDIDSAVAFAAGLEDAVWTYARVHRTAMTTLGLEKSMDSIDGAMFSKALEVLSASDQAKFAWGAAELKAEDAEVEVMLTENETLASDKKKAKEKLNAIRKKCNPQELKLMNGVVLPPNIRTTFADIRAPKETVEALKTLTSLSLIRPEAFSYGVLATDKIPGLLLYGPPGTGKTLLAKAVAKESGATVLEVTAADLNDMFVGQGEKNVRAVFTLAKKLSPCVVFIDEADAIFSARGEHNRNAHREMINQFLREWDGMTDFSAFIMVATNRPFDLDEAVLRRLPRRLLIDLPVEKDREAILNIHLKDEILDSSVSLPTLAKETPFYSGSDLKNLSVAAALACIRDENALAALHTGEEPYAYPEKRTLLKKHFDTAMEEISASISEDMSTLTAIRKFDEKYGDRKGRRKKGPGMGFGGTKVLEKDSEAARVRKTVGEV